MNHLGKMKKSTVLEKHTHEHICKAIENILSTGPVWPLWRFPGKKAGDHFPVMPGRWCQEEEFPTRSVCDVVKKEGDLERLVTQEGNLERLVTQNP